MRSDPVESLRPKLTLGTCGSLPSRRRSWERGGDSVGHGSAATWPPGLEKPPDRSASCVFHLVDRTGGKAEQREQPFQVDHPSLGAALCHGDTLDTFTHSALTTPLFPSLFQRRKLRPEVGISCPKPASEAGVPIQKLERASPWIPCSHPQTLAFQPSQDACLHSGSRPPPIC